MQQISTSTNVIDLRKVREARQRAERQKKNQDFASLIISRWSDRGPTNGRALFAAIVAKAATSESIATPQRAEILLPVLLEVLDEMDSPGESESEATHYAAL